MKRILTIFAVLCFSITGFSQDVSVIGFNAPVSGCALTSTENVTIRIFNYGATLPAASSFNVSYTINAGPPVTELLTLGSNFLTNSTLIYTFTTQANLSTAGTYTLTATTALAGDINPTNDAFTGYTVTNTAPSVGGTVSGGTNVCISGNSGTLTLSGHTGSVLGWEYSTDGGSTWISISNTTTTQAYNNLTVATQYRAQVQNGGCTAANSSIASMTIDPATVGGTTSGSATRCSGTNSGNITLSGYTGSIVRWEFSTDGGVTWTNIANTTTTQSYLNLTQTTIYRARVQSGSCVALYSTNSTITISPVTVGGTVAPAATAVCSGSNSGTLTLSGHTGSVIRWEYSTDGGVTWTNIVNTTTSQNYLNLTATRLYRARVQSGACTFQYSSAAAVNVGPASVGGSVTSSATVCSGTNSGTLTLSGHTGSVLQWEFSTDGGVTWTVIANTTTTENYLNLVTTTMYRALVQQAGCTSSYSSAATITVDQPSVGGTVSGGITVCSGSNSGTLTLAGHTGTITGWESSNDSIIWVSTGNTTTTQTFTNLLDTTYYRVIITSGVCAPDTSTVDSIIVDPVTVGGTISPAMDTVCSGANSGTLTLGGETGSVVQWEFSQDGGVTWITIINTTTTQAYNNLTTATIYRALVQSGVCSQQYSAQSVISIDAQPAGGTLYSDITVCGGSNSGTLTLVGHVGSISNWESSTDGGLTWGSIANTTYQENYLNVAMTTMYRVIVTSGVCPMDTSNAITITVDAPSVGGTVSMDDTVCAGANGATLTLSGETGSVTGWELSNDGGVTWVNIANTSTSQAYMNLTTTSMYRVRVANGVCPSTTSDTATITVDPIVDAGTLSGQTTVCANINNGQLDLTGYSGSIVSWELSNDGGVTWIPNGNTAASETFTNLTDTMWYRVVLASGVCGGDTSNIQVVFVDPNTVPGTTTVDDTVCSGSNAGTVYLAGQVGAVQNWEMSTDGVNWIAIASTADSINYLNLTTTTWYRAWVLSGVCTPALASNATAITVNPVSVAGTISGSTSVCEGTGSGTLTLSGSTGTIVDWESSTDGGVTWTSLGNTTTSQAWSNPIDTTWYRVIVMSGVCTPDTSMNAWIITYPKPVAAFSADTVCWGSATTFTNSTTIASGGIQFQSWDFGDADASVATNPSHTYMTADTFNVVLITVSNLGCSDTATQDVIVHGLPDPSITVGGTTTLCQGDSVMLSVASFPQNWYDWSTGDSTSTIYGDTTFNYVIQVTDTVTGCMAWDSVMITVIPRPIADAGLDTNVSAGSSITLLGSGGSTFDWIPTVGLSDPSSANPLCTPAYTVTYTLTVTDANGCSDTDAVTVTMVKDLNLIISNVITANGDGFNDVWNVQNIEFYPNNHVIIYNRNGMEVYEMNGYNNSWNGSYNDGMLPDGTYYYVLEFPAEDVTFKGAITIVSEKK
jgi:gliding motility-associated-like protein